MRKYGLRVLVGLIAFAIGLNLTWLIYEVASLKIECSNFCIIPKLKSLSHLNQNGDIEVDFKEFKKTEKSVMVVLEVVNNSSDSIHYWLVDSAKYPDVDLKFNEIIDEHGGYCGNSTFSLRHLHSGELIEFEDYAYPLEKYLNEKGNLQIGYSFKKDGENESQIYWSEKVQIPDWVKNEIKKEKAGIK